MKSFKKVCVFSVLLMVSFGVAAQKDKTKRKSPPAQISQTINEKIVTIDYSRPSKRGRVVFGDLEDFDKVWRTGANETTWIEFSENVSVEGSELKAGKYGLFTIPGEKQWTIIFNKKWDGWGAYEYDSSEDVLRVYVDAKKLEDVVEQFTIAIDEKGNASLMWDQTMVSFFIE